MPVGGDAGEVEEMLPGPFGEVLEGPVEGGFDPVAGDEEDLEDGAVAEAEDEAAEVEEGNAEGDAGEGVPGGEGGTEVPLPESSKRWARWMRMGVLVRLWLWIGLGSRVCWFWVWAGSDGSMSCGGFGFAQGDNYIVNKCK